MRVAGHGTVRASRGWRLLGLLLGLAALAASSIVWGRPAGAGSPEDGVVTMSGPAVVTVGQTFTVDARWVHPGGDRLLMVDHLSTTHPRELALRSTCLVHTQANGTSSPCVPYVGGAVGVYAGGTTTFRYTFEALGPLTDGVISMNASSPISSISSDQLRIHAVDPASRVDLFPAFRFPQPTRVGQPFAITGSVVNGGSEAVSEVTATITMADGLRPDAATVTSSEGACEIAGQVVTCSLGTVPARGTVDLQVRATPLRSGAGTTRVVVSSDRTEDAPDPHPNLQELVIFPGQVYTDTSIAWRSFTGHVTIGSTYRFAASAYNRGPAPAALEVAITVPDHLAIESASYVGDPVLGSGSCTVTGQQVRCASPTPAPVGVRLDAIIYFEATRVAAGQLVATVSSDLPEPSPDLWPSTVTSTVTSYLTKATAVGTVFDRGVPAAGATLLAYEEDDTWLPTASLVTGPDGRYVITGLPNGFYKLFVSPPPGSPSLGHWLGGTTRRTATTVFATELASTIELAPIDLQPGGSISGRIAGPDGAAVAGAEVTAWHPDHAWLASARATSGPDGTYRLSGLVGDDYHIRFRPPPGSGLLTEWHADQRDRVLARTVAVADGVELRGLDARLEEGGSFTGRITGPDGAAVADVRVVAFATRDRWVGTAEVRSGPDGRYALGALPPGTYQLRFVPPAASGLAIEWHDGTTDRRLAVAHEVLLGSASDGIDATLLAVDAD